MCCKSSPKECAIDEHAKNKTKNKLKIKEQKYTSTEQIQTYRNKLRKKTHRINICIVINKTLKQEQKAFKKQLNQKYKQIKTI